MKVLFAFGLAVVSLVVCDTKWGCAGAAVLHVTQDEERGTATDDGPTSLPSEWHGRWSGEVTTYNGGGRAATFQMELEIKPTDNPEKLDWKIVYDGKAGRSERPYQLNVLNAKLGSYEIDERNGIRLAATLLGDAMCYHFAAGGQRLWGSYRLDPKSQHIVFELFSGSEESESVTGGRSVPEVRTIPPQSRQVAVLRRVADDSQPPPKESAKSEQSDRQP